MKLTRHSITGHARRGLLSLALLACSTLAFAAEPSTKSNRATNATECPDREKSMHRDDARCPHRAPAESRRDNSGSLNDAATQPAARGSSSIMQNSASRGEGASLQGNGSAGSDRR